jgi:hypothetical protein
VLSRDLQTLIRFFMVFPNGSNADDAELMSPHLQGAIAHFRRAYPTGSIMAEWVTVHGDQHVVRAIVQVGSIALGSAMAMGTTVEQAEDRAKLRAIATVSLPTPETAGTPPSWLSSSSSSLSQPWQSPINVPPLPTATGTEVGDRTPVDPASLPSTPSSLSMPTHWETTEMPPETSQASGFQNVGASPSSPQPSPQISPANTEPVNGEIEPALSTVPESSSSSLSKTATTQEKTARSSADTKGASTRSTKKPSKKKSPTPSPTPSTTTDQPPVSADDATPSNADASMMSLNADLSDIIAKTSVELRRLGWTDVQGREHLEKAYGKRSRQQLTDPELLDFLSYLESQPSPL